jgi:hypothetical protein
MEGRREMKFNGVPHNGKTGVQYSIGVNLCVELENQVDLLIEVELVELLMKM